jgi:hypothetical protein
MAAMIEMLDDNLSSIVENVWRKIYAISKTEPLPQDNCFVVAWGNSEKGRKYDSLNKLKKDWRMCCRLGWRQSVNLYYNGKLIRVVNFFNAKMLTDTPIKGDFGQTEYVRVQYKKFPYTTE